MFVRVPVDQVEANPFQTRTGMEGIEELGESILKMASARPETSGLLQVPPARLWDVDGEQSLPLEHLESQEELLALLRGGLVLVELAAGHRRLQAFRDLHLTHNGYSTFPVELQVLSDEQMADIAWTENAQREDVNPIDEALAIQTAMVRFDWTQAEVGERWGLSRSAVANKLRLLKLPDEALEAVQEGAISERHGRVLLSAMGKSPAIYDEMAREVLPSAPPSDEVLERAQALASRFGRVWVSPNLEGLTCVACGGAVERINENMYRAWDEGPPRGYVYMCRSCYRAATDWTPPSVLEAEKTLGDVVRQKSIGLEATSFPVDVEVGEGDPDVHSSQCVECKYMDGLSCLDSGCYKRKSEHWQSYNDSIFMTRLHERFGVTVPIVDVWGGYDLSEYDETDRAMVASGWCVPGKCERLGVRRQASGGIRVFEDLPYTYHCDHASSHKACRRRYERSLLSEDEEEAKKLSEGRAKQHRTAVRQFRDRAARQVGEALLEGNAAVWAQVAKRFDYLVKMGQEDVLEYLGVVVNGILGKDESAFVHVAYDWAAEDAVEYVERQIRERIGQMGVAVPVGTEDLVRRLERIEGFVLDEAGNVRQGLSVEQIEGNLENLAQLAAEIAEADLSQQDFERLNERQLELAAILRIAA